MGNEFQGRFLKHHGILGQKWGVRRFQNPDGSLTDAGKKRSSKEEQNQAEKTVNDAMQKHSAMKKDSKEKAEYEQQLLRKASIETMYQDKKDDRKGRESTYEENQLYSEIARLVYEKFGDYGSHKGANAKCQKILDDAQAQKITKDEMLGEALKAIGFEDTPQNRYYIQGYLFTD